MYHFRVPAYQFYQSGDALADFLSTSRT